MTDSPSPLATTEQIEGVVAHLDRLLTGQGEVLKEEMGPAVMRLREALRSFKDLTVEQVEAVEEAAVATGLALAANNHPEARAQIGGVLMRTFPTHSWVARQLANLEERVRELDFVPERMEELTARTDVAMQATAADEMGEKFKLRAKDHEKGWQRSAAGLGVAMATLVGLAALLHFTSDLGEEATTAQIVSSAGFAVLILGLGVYIVKIMGQSYRSHRNLQAVNLARADALATFHLLVRDQADAEVRGLMASSLAGLIFARELTGYESESPPVTVSDQVAQTILTRLLPPASKS